MYNFELRGKEPIFEYLYKCILNDISSGILKSGERLPSKRNMASLYGISLTSVQTAYDQLISEGYITSKPRKGYYVEKIGVIPKLPSKSTPYCNTENSEKTDSRTQNNIFPLSVWSRIMRRTISENSGHILDRMPAEGIYELRCEISDYLFRNQGIAVSPDRIVIGAGTEYLAWLLVLLIGRTKIYGFEDPGYPKIPLIYSSCGAGVRYLETDAQGIIPEDIEQSKVSVIHISPSNHYPLGGVMPVARRYALLGWLEMSSERYIIEDDYDSEIYLSGRRILPLTSIDKSGRVIYMNTFTKTISPSFRVGYAVLPEKLSEKLKHDFFFLSCTVPSYEQYALAKFISGGYFERHLSRIRTQYRKRRDEVITELKKFKNDQLAFSLSNSGTNIIIYPKTALSENEIAEIAEANQTLKLLNNFRHSKIKGDKTLILDFSGIQCGERKWIHAVSEIINSKAERKTK